jgi:N-acetylglutamate synthase-like GNAT family acetyltransferase
MSSGLKRQISATRGPRVGVGADGPVEPFRIEAARAADVAAIAALLRAADLPHEDFAPHLAHFLVARDSRGTVIGAVGAEVHAPEALLRSLVVAEEARGQGLGDTLVEALAAAAESWGVQRWWLLTTTAERFFAARSFSRAERASAPAAIRASGQFRGGCGGSAVCLTRARATTRP